LAGFAALGPRAGDVADLVAATRALTAPLREADLPLIVEHGDLSHPNILVDGASRLGIIDWELSRTDGLVGHDLFIFLAFVAFARHDAHDLPRQRAALDEAFFAPAGWGRTAAEEYLRRRGVDAHLLLPLMVACWARYSAQMLPRLWGTTGGAPGESLAGEALTRSLDVVNQARDVNLWRHVVARAVAVGRA
jgi:aminoglycoside phosphotransferase (APT) family kinase protein